MKKQYAVLGLGRFGSKIARELYYKKQDVIAIDKDECVIESIKDEVTRAYVGDITDEVALVKKIGSSGIASAPPPFRPAVCNSCACSR